MSTLDSVKQVSGRHQRIVQDALVALDEQSSDFGFEAAGYTFTPRPPHPGGSLPRPTAIDMHSRLKLGWWRDTYVKQEMWRIDPVYRATLTTTLPLWWSYDARPKLVVGYEHDATAQQLWMFRYCFDNTGVRTGLSVPMHTAFGGFGYVVFASRAPLSELSSSGKDCEDRLLAIAHRFHHEVAPSLGLVEGHEVTLSERELDCLSLAAIGKTLDESAEILSLSRSTVRFHLRNACTKLGVSNRMQAVTRAAYLGLLGPTY